MEFHIFLAASMLAKVHFDPFVSSCEQFERQAQAQENYLRYREARRDGISLRMTFMFTAFLGLDESSRKRGLSQDLSRGRDKSCQGDEGLLTCVSTHLLDGS